MPSGDCFTFAEDDGLIEPLVDLGGAVAAGEVLARVHPSPAPASPRRAPRPPLRPPRRPPLPRPRQGRRLRRRRRRPGFKRGPTRENPSSPYRAVPGGRGGRARAPSEIAPATPLGLQAAREHLVAGLRSRARERGRTALKAPTPSATPGKRSGTAPHKSAAPRRRRASTSSPPRRSRPPAARGSPRLEPARIRFRSTTPSPIMPRSLSGSRVGTSQSQMWCARIRPAPARISWSSSGSHQT